MLDISVVSSVFAGLLQIIGYFLYSRDVFQEKIIPNTASWLIWAIGGGLTTVSYVLVSGDLIKDIVPVVCSISVVLIFIFSLIWGKFKRIDRFEWTIVVLDLSITALWFFSSESFLIHMLFVLSTFPSFVPIIRHVWKNPSSENSTPWIFWSLAYLLMTVTVLIRYEKWEDLFYPVTLFFLHIIIATLSSDYIMRSGRNFAAAGQKI